MNYLSRLFKRRNRVTPTRASNRALQVERHPHADESSDESSDGRSDDESIEQFFIKNNPRIDNTTRISRPTTRNMRRNRMRRINELNNKLVAAEDAAPVASEDAAPVADVQWHSSNDEDDDGEEVPWDLSPPGSDRGSDSGSDTDTDTDTDSPRKGESAKTGGRRRPRSVRRSVRRRTRRTKRRSTRRRGRKPKRRVGRRTKRRFT
jgi:hypothetical protein